MPITVGLGTSPSGATLSGTKTVTSTNGTAAFSGLSVDKAGTYTHRRLQPGGPLPDCLEVLDLGILTILVGPPCVVSRTTNAAGDAIVTYTVPADPRDPAGRY